MVGDFECHICYEHKNPDKLKKLVCNHELCNDCYKKLKQNTCPFCRHVITPYNPPSNHYHFSNNNFQEESQIDSDIPVPYSRVRRNMTRNRRRNLSFDEVLKRRRRIKKRCKRKWMRKNGRLAKINFYDL